MAEHDYNLIDQSGANFRVDTNNALSAIVSQNSKATAPTTTFAYMLWADTTSGFMKQRNAANSAWVTLWKISDGVSSTQVKVGSFTRDLTLGAGTQAITGMGFQPKLLIFDAGVGASAANEMSVGFDDGTTPGSLSQRSPTGTNTWGANAKAVSFVTAGATTAEFTVTTLGSDGFTVTWTVGGSPTGTMTIYYAGIA